MKLKQAVQILCPDLTLSSNGPGRHKLDLTDIKTLMEIAKSKKGNWKEKVAKSCASQNMENIAHTLG